MPSEPGFVEKYKRQRVLALSVVLVGAAVYWLNVRVDDLRKADWSAPHWVLVCPLVSPGTDYERVQALVEGSEEMLESWMSEQAAYWGLPAEEPIRFSFAAAHPAGSPPPRLPDPEASFFERWRGTSAFLSYFEDKAHAFPEPVADATRLYLLVYPEAEASAWDGFHSVGTRRGRRGVVFASDRPEAWGNVRCVIAHEVLHTLGAPEHRDEKGVIQWPQGVAEPDLQPLYPQRQAEIMALGIPLAPGRELRVTALEDVVMGEWTAEEIGWLVEADEGR